MGKRYVVGWYAEDQSYGGPEEGGWWYSTGHLVRSIRVFTDEQKAYAFAKRANHLMGIVQKKLWPVYSAAYTGGRYGAHVFENNLPAHYPEERPYYS